MSVKQAVRAQYQATVDSASGCRVEIPAKGWIRTVRKALGMSGAQLAERMGVTRGRIAQAEKSEIEGGVTLKSMKAIAAAMGCEFVYAFVPPDRIEKVIIAQARKRAQAIVGRAGKHMALEGQAISDSRTQNEITRLTNQLIYEMPADFWRTDND